MEYLDIKLKMKAAHIALLDELKKEYGVQNKSKVLELLLNDLLQPEFCPEK